MKTLEMIVYYTPQTSFVRTVSFKHSPKEIEKISNFQQLYTTLHFTQNTHFIPFFTNIKMKPL